MKLFPGSTRDNRTGFTACFGGPKGSPRAGRDAGVLERGLAAALVLFLAAAFGTACGAARQPVSAARPTQPHPAADIVVQGAVDSELQPLLAAVAGKQEIQIAAWTTVRQGENLTEIAERYSTDVATLKSANGLSSSRIVAGQRLRIPSADRPRMIS